jgi:SpoIID/LytB domain protein
VRRKLLGGLAAASLILGLVPTPVVAASGHAVVIETRGWGHGVGMSQDGALAMGQDGATASDILGHFYPGTSITRRRGATVRVSVLDAGRAVVVAFPGGGEVRDSRSGSQSPGFPVTVNPGGSVELSVDGSGYRAKPLSGATAAPVAPAPAAEGDGAEPDGEAEVESAAAPTTTAPDGVSQLLGGLLAPPTTAAAAAAPPPSRDQAAAAAGDEPEEPTDPVSGRSLWAMPKGGSSVALPAQGRRYRGVIEATSGGGGIKLVNELDVEQYLRGMGEVLEPGWPAASLQAQAIAARTYALWTTAAGRELCSSQQCQVYLGEQAEYGAMNAAVEATQGQVLVHEGALVEALYSANAGGVSATAEEGFGPDSIDQPYLQAVPHRSVDPKVATTTIDMAELGRRFGYGGEVSDVRIGRQGPSGRALEVVIDGSAGPLAVSGQRFWHDLNLPSTLYTIRVEAPPQPEGQGASLFTEAGDGVPDAGSGAVGPAATGVDALVPAGSLGRAPWVAVAVLLMSAWAVAARRVSGA